MLAGILLAIITAKANFVEGTNAFTDPSGVQEMEEGWKERGIKYDSSAEDVDLVISLDQHVYPALLPFIRRYSSEKDLKILVSKGTCGISAGKLTRKEIDMGGFCCPPGKTDRLPGLVFHTIGITPIALLVYSDNAVDSIAFEQAREIFQGLVHRWSDLRDSGGQAGKNLPVQNPFALKLANYLIKQAEKLNSKFDVIPASNLRQAGWKFKGNELIGKPR